MSTAEIGTMLFAAGMVGLLVLSVLSVLAVFVMAVRDREWAFLLFMIIPVALAVTVIVGALLMYVP